MKGGLITYVHINYRVKELNLYSDSKVWEGQFFEINGNGLRAKLLLTLPVTCYFYTHGVTWGVIYPPPLGNQLSECRREFIFGIYVEEKISS